MLKQIFSLPVQPPPLFRPCTLIESEDEGELALDSIEKARQLAALEGICLSDEREAALSAGLEGMRRIAEALARRDYGEAEPANRFRPPRTGR